MRRARAAAWLPLAFVLASGCSVAPRPPSPDPIEGGTRAEGRLGDARPAETAFCVSQEVPLSVVVLTSDGAAVRPAPASRSDREPDYALVLRRPDGETRWVRQVGGADASAMALAAYRLDRALSGCAAPVGGAT